jgi:CelD/BcsL family acetyltransferase involved in cellulose biosynthesis
MHTDPVRAELLPAKELSSGDLARWRELAARALEPNPFFEPEYLLPLAAGLGQEDELCLLVVRGADDWRACMPVQAVSPWRRIPLRSLTTWRGHRLYGLLGTPLVGPAQPTEALASLLGAMPEAYPGARFAALEWLSTDGELAPAIAELLESRRPRPVLFEHFERAVLRRRPEPTYVEETLSSKHRRELRRQRRKLGESLGEEPTTVDRGGEDAAYAELVALEAAGKAGMETVMAADPGHVAFFERMCRGFAAAGRLQLLSLQGGGQTVAMKCNILAGSTIFFFKIAYDERWAAFSPGIQLELEMLKFFHEDSDAVLMDSCADHNNAMINRLWPDRRRIETQLLPAQDLAGRAARPALIAAAALRKRKHERKNR